MGGFALEGTTQADQSQEMRDAQATIARLQADLEVRKADFSGKMYSELQQLQKQLSHAEEQLLSVKEQKDHLQQSSEAKDLIIKEKSDQLASVQRQLEQESSILERLKRRLLAAREEMAQKDKLLDRLAHTKSEKEKTHVELTEQVHSARIRVKHMESEIMTDDEHLFALQQHEDDSGEERDLDEMADGELAARVFQATELKIQVIEQKAEHEEELRELTEIYTEAAETQRTAASELVEVVKEHTETLAVKTETAERAINEVITEITAEAGGREDRHRAQTVLASMAADEQSQSDLSHIRGLVKQMRVSGIAQLSLAHTSLTPNLVRLLADGLRVARSVSSVRFTHVQLGNDGAQVIAAAIQDNEVITTVELESIDAGAAGWTAILDALQSHPSITSLNIAKNDFPVDAAEALANLLSHNRKLQQLNLAATSLGDEALSVLTDALGGNQVLTMLVLDNCALSAASMSDLSRALSTNRSLTQISLTDNKLGVHGGEAIGAALAANNTLQDVGLGNTDLKREGATAVLAALATNTSVTRLDLSGCNIEATDEEFTNALQGAVRVRDLSLWGNMIGMRGGQALSQWLRRAPVVSLNARGCSLQASGADAISAALSECPTLTHLNLAANSIRGQSIAVLATAVAKHPALTSLSLSGNSISWPLLAEHLPQMRLNSLDLALTQLDDKGIAVLIPGIIGCTTLHTLQLAFNYIGQAGAKSVAQMLSAATHLTDVDLDSNSMAEGVPLVVGALNANTTLRRLVLSSCGLGPDGGRAVGDMLRVNKGLRILELKQNNLAHDGTRAIADALKMNGTLETIILDSNGIDDAGAHVIAEFVQLNSVVSNISLKSNNLVSGDGIALLKRAAQRNGRVKIVHS
eukprot:TRINITY_DN9170_c0_g1_i1.p1 TRINITY_DN9170_c0_g1~~TRINITY_DN9170_c0_g1_i1.p1  ORF type:complete len:986 (+),score=276.26 TRINITY_DN9170_c0_g1_i1:351-2960(+)